jgi:hypothetical protein
MLFCVGRESKMTHTLTTQHHNKLQSKDTEGRLTEQKGGKQEKQCVLALAVPPTKEECQGFACDFLVL